MELKIEQLEDLGTDDMAILKVRTIRESRFDQSRLEYVAVNTAMDLRSAV
jgi:hypothetical protein